MSCSFQFTPYDILLVIVVSVQAAVLAYLRQPRWKAFVLSLPIPFTLLTLSLNQPINATNVLGLVYLLLFSQAVLLFHKSVRLPIIPAIFLSALGYCLLASVTAPHIPKTTLAFWLAWGFTITLGWALYLWLPPRGEPAHRTELPVWIKLPIILGVVTMLVLIRNSLQGFATLFPLVGVMAMYESRYSLWTISRQFTVIMVSMGTMMGVVYIAQSRWSLFPALMAGWLVFLPVFGAITLNMWSKMSRLPESSLASQGFCE